MQTINEHPWADDKSKVDSLVNVLPFNERIPRNSGDVAFDKAWEIRAFSMTVALHEKLGFPWEEFQQQLIAAIRAWESKQSDLSEWSYYERWMAALEEFARSKGWVESAELDRRTDEILAQPRNAHHQTPMREPVAIVSGKDQP